MELVGVSVRASAFAFSDAQDKSSNERLAEAILQDFRLLAETLERAAELCGDSVDSQRLRAASAAAVRAQGLAERLVSRLSTVR